MLGNVIAGHISTFKVSRFFGKVYRFLSSPSAFNLNLKSATHCSMFCHSVCLKGPVPWKMTSMQNLYTNLGSHWGSKFLGLSSLWRTGTLCHSTIDGTCIRCRPSRWRPGGSAAWSACQPHTGRMKGRAGPVRRCGGRTCRREADLVG